jgi:hypothetical protein
MFNVKSCCPQNSIDHGSSEPEVVVHTQLRLAIPNLEGYLCLNRLLIDEDIGTRYRRACGCSLILKKTYGRETVRTGAETR